MKPGVRREADSASGKSSSSIVCAAVASTGLDDSLLKASTGSSRSAVTNDPVGVVLPP
jgi:hypothetical protein